MENNTYPKWKHALMNGIYVGIALIIISLIFYVADVYTAKWPGFISYAVLFAGIGYSIYLYRDNHLNGFITYGEGVSLGFLTGLFAAILAAIYTFVFMHFLGDGMIQEMLNATEESIITKRPDISDEELDMAMKWAKKMMQPGWMTLMAFLANAFFSFIFALIASIFVKKEETQV